MRAAPSSVVAVPARAARPPASATPPLRVGQFRQRKRSTPSALDAYASDTAGRSPPSDPSESRLLRKIAAAPAMTASATAVTREGRTRESEIPMARAAARTTAAVATRITT
jgi:hypothetical protein